MKNSARLIELLAPARNAEVAIEAINHGADAVYMGPSQFGARALAGNSVEDFARVCDYAHRFGARVYATVNTIVYDEELKLVEAIVKQLYDAQVDALIVQDMALLRLDLPPIALHASTQCDIRTPDKARFLEQLGFSQLVMARELSLTEIQDIRQAVKVPLEAFVHGALCVSYSGRCALSQAVKGRSANRGQCAQMCRLPYDLEDENGNKIVEGKHLLSLRDLNQTDRVAQMLQAGVSSFKIEGRLKDVAYVKNVVAHYRRILDENIAASDGLYKRLSSGEAQVDFMPDPERSFNRSFTHYFIDGKSHAGRMASIHTPKSMGQPVATVARSRGRNLDVKASRQLVNGDGLSYFDDNNQFCGIRVNVAQGNRLTLREPVFIKPGTQLYRTADKAFDDKLARPSAHRVIAVDATLYEASGAVVLRLDDERGNSVTHSIKVDSVDEARSSQEARQRDVLSKLGDTIYRLRSCNTMIASKFVPVSVLAQLRRETISLLDRANAVRHQRELRRREQPSAQAPSVSLCHSDNVANHLAAQVYKDHGVQEIEPAVEVSDAQWSNGRGCLSPVLMHTRYCIRRELGACRKEKGAKKLPHRLFLRSSNVLLEVHCDCSACEMKITFPQGD
ncbi:MAG: U32 family peptidase [Muribaculaceae bacterium]|nr:U32 family peptidase [Muribaculaceae bacterium]